MNPYESPQEESSKANAVHDAKQNRPGWRVHLRTFVVLILLTVVVAFLATPADPVSFLIGIVVVFPAMLMAYFLGVSVARRSR